MSDAKTMIQFVSLHKCSISSSLDMFMTLDSNLHSELLTEDSYNPLFTL